MSAVTFAGLVGSATRGFRFPAYSSEIGLPGCFEARVVVARRSRIATGADVEQETTHGSQIVGHHVAEFAIELQYTGPHCEILVPSTKLYAGSRERIVAGDDRRVERGDERRVQKIEQVGHRGA